MKIFKVFFYLIPIIFTVESYGQQGWQRINEYYPYSYEFGQYVSQNTAFLTSDMMKGVIKTTDKGLTWKFKSGGINPNIAPINHTLVFFDENTGILAGQYGFIYKTTDAGESWRQIFTSANGYLVNAVSFLNANTGFAIKDANTALIKTTDGGEHWISIAGSSQHSRDILFLNENLGFRTTSQFYPDYTLSRTMNGGITWDSIYTSGTTASMKKLSDNAFLYMDSKKLYKVSNNGDTWQLLASSTDEHLFNHIEISNNSNFILTCSNKLAMVTTNAGNTWQSKILPGSGFLMGNNQQEGILAGYMGSIYKSSVSFNNFTDINSSKVTEKILDYQLLDADNIFLYADSNCIIKSSNGGSTWTKLHMNFSPNSYSFANLNTGYAAYNKNICKTYDGGLTWDTVYKFTNYISGFYAATSNISFLTPDFGMVNFRSSGSQMYSDIVYYTSDGGITWQTMNAGGGSSGTAQSGNTTTMRNFQMKSLTTGYYISINTLSNHTGSSSYYYLKKTVNGGANWIDILPNAGTNKVYCSAFINETTGFISTDSSKFKKTTDGGLTWAASAILPFSMGELTMVDEQTGFCTAGINLYRTSDGGITWQIQTNYLPVSDPYPYYKIKFLNSLVGYFIGGNGEIFKTTTGGTVFIGSNNSLAADKYSLSQNYPNPFNPETKINFSIPKNGLVKIIVYDMLGREVKELVNEFKQQGSYNVSFNSASLSSGIYFYKLITNDFAETKKMILVK